MNPLQAKTQAKAIPINTYLDQITTKKGNKYICPFCGSGTGPRRTPGGSIDPTTNKFSCFACDNMEMDIFDLVAKVENLEPAAAFERVYQMYNLDEQRTNKEEAPEPPKASPRIKEYIEKAHARINDYPEAINYLNGRGINQGSIDRFHLGYDPNRKQIVIPYNPDGTYYISRSINSKDFKKPKTEEAGPEPIFNPGALDGTGPVFVVEAPLCAISIMQAGGQAVAIVGTGYNKLIDYIKRHRPEAQVILSLDNDDPGAAAQAKLSADLKAIGITSLEENIAGSYKDPNEALQAEPEALAARIQEAIEKAGALAYLEAEEARAEYQKTSAAAHLQNFMDGIQNSIDTPYIPTGFTNLDQPLDGGLYEGLYIIGAISSLGKTTFAMQLGDQIADGGDHVLIFSLEMARSELIAKSISRQTIINIEHGQEYQEMARSTREITTGRKWQWYSDEQKQHIYKAMEDYGNYAGRIWIHEGIGDIGAMKIRETIEQHIKIWNRKPVVIIDYLQILEPFDMRATDKQNTDKVVLELKKISRDHKIPIIAISSFNRDNYKAPVNMASFKESGAIEYSSDVLIGLQLKGIEDINGKPTKDFNVDEAKSKEPREIELKILKNRNGRTGGIMLFDYYQKYNYFLERE